jgi:triacylglycerol esterase/lipase EstA (alpha/beta hydrolase family)
MRRGFLRSWRRASALVCAAVASVAAGATAPAQAGTYLPVVYSVAAGFSHLAPDEAPPGANNWSCRPPAEHPYPVILVHGTFANQDDNWQALSPLLYDNGYCVFTFNYGGPPLLGTLYGVNDIAQSAAELGVFVDQVLAATGAAKVDLVGHSQGGMMPNYYLQFLGGASKVHDMVALAPSNRGTTLDGLVQLAGYIPGVAEAINQGVGSVCEACVEQEVGSAFIQKLDATGITVPGVTYTVISTRYDEVVTPYTSQFLSGPNVSDIVIQDECPIDYDGHVGLAYDHIALRDVLNALDPAQAVPPVCTFVGFETGG